MARGGDAKAYFRLTPKGLREMREAYATLTRLWQVLTELKMREA
jgi:DNA-binding PadR family transcriptional regulator